MVVGTVTQLVAEVLAGWLVVETQERSELPISTTRSIAHVVIEDVHGPFVCVDFTTVVILEASAPSVTCRAAIEVEVDVQTTVTVVHVHHSTFQEGRSVFVLRQGNTSCSYIFYEVSRLTHVSVDVIELQQGVNTIVEVGIITSTQNVPSLAGTAAVLSLIASVELQLGAVHGINLKL